MIALEVVFLAIFWSWVFCAALFLRNTLLPRLPLTAVPAQRGIPADTVTFPATDGVLLQGWKILSGDPSRPWIIGCHGLGSNRSDLLEIASGLHKAGFNMLLMDFRAHGGSAGWTTSFGGLERRDLEGALAFLGSQPEIPARPYGVYGISMGGAVALMVAGTDERIGAVAAESPYASLGDAMDQHLRLLYPWLPRIPFAWYLHTAYRLRFGVWPRDVSPEQALKRMGARPLLLIRGGSDERMPDADMQRLMAAAPGPNALWLIPGAGHLAGYSMDPDAYLARLVEFFSKAL